MNMNEKLQQYAKLAVRIGVNVQKDQILVLRCPAEFYEFARMLTKEGYEAGAKEVVVHFRDEQIRRLNYDYSPLSVFETIPEWQAESLNYYAREKACFISLIGGDPEIFKGVESAKLKAYSIASDKAFEPFQKSLMSSENPWNIIALPSEVWAKKVFPDLSTEEAMERLWEAIFTSVRIGDGDVVEKWKNHNKTLAEQCKKLNELQFAKLHYKNSLGTDFTVGLVKNHCWEGGSEVNPDNIEFVANMPTEEVFTMPDHRIADGKVVSSLPLSYEGTLIKNFSLTFKNGRVEEFTAEEGYEALERLLNSDEGSRHLGEVALVPYDSPISNMKILFYNTLFDENASCHLALGRCYPNNIEGGTTMSEDELFEKGGNKSMNHVDFMIGTSDLSITGIKEDGTEIKVFENGNWVL